MSNNKQLKNQVLGTTTALTSVSQEDGATLMLKELSNSLVAETIEQSKLVLRENFYGPNSLRVWDLPRIKMPSAGVQFWSLPDENGNLKPVQEIYGIIAYRMFTRSFWKETYDQSGGGSPPDCASTDGIQGHGDPGIMCEACEYSEFGSSTKGVGQACRAVDLLFLMRPGHVLPTLMGVTPGSLKVFKKYLVGLTTANLRVTQVVTKFILQTDRNKQGIVYSILTPTVGTRIPSEMMSQVDQWLSALRPIFNSFNPQDVKTVAAEFASTEA